MYTEDNINEKIRNNIKFLIQKYANNSQKEFAKLVHIEISHLNQLITAKRDKIPLLLIVNIAIAFKEIDLYWLLGLKDEHGNIVLNDTEASYDKKDIKALENQSLVTLLESNKNQSVAIVRLVQLLDKLNNQ